MRVPQGPDGASESASGAPTQNESASMPVRPILFRLDLITSELRCPRCRTPIPQSVDARSHALLPAAAAVAAAAAAVPVLLGLGLAGSMLVLPHPLPSASLLQLQSVVVSQGQSQLTRWQTLCHRWLVLFMLVM